MPTATEVKIFGKPEGVFKAMAKEIYKLTLNSSQPRFNIVLSGGNSPAKLFERIAKKYASVISWERIHFWWGDERCVPPNDENSNFKLADDLLFSKISIPQSNIHRIRKKKPKGMRKKSKTI